MAGRPLVGTRVLDCVAGPLAHVGRSLAELGAEVIRIEFPGASDRTTGRSANGVPLDFPLANLGKRAVLLDPAAADGIAAFERLLGEADILLHDLSPAANAFAQLALGTLAARHPTLVVLQVSDFGSNSAIRDWKGSDAVFHALSGELSRSGNPGREPILPPARLAYACAAVQATMAVLVAYFHRLRSGAGDLLDFSILDGAMQALDPGFGIAGSATAGVPASRLPRGRSEARFQYPILPCKDGFVRICVLAPRQWQGMFKWLREPAEFADPSFNKLVIRFQSRELMRAIAAHFAGRTRAELESEGERFGVPTASVYELGEALAHPQLVARNAFTVVETPEGVRLTVPNGTIVIDGERMGAAGPPPGPPEPIAEVAFLHPRPSFPAASAAPGSLPAAGLRVLDLGVIVVGAESGRIFGDLGADVVKVENPAFPDGSRQTRDGGPMSVTFAAGNRNKRSLGLDLRSSAGKRILGELIATADVLFSNFKPGTLAALGFGDEELRRINPRLVACDSSAWGPTGPWSARMGYGPLVRAGTGLTHLWRYADQADGFADAITVYPDHSAARTGVIGTLALLIRRLRTGQGGQVSIAQGECIVDHLGVELAAASLGVSPERIEGFHANVYPCAGDDEWCAIAVEQPGVRDALCDLIGVARSADSVSVRQELRAWMARHQPLAAADALQAAGITAAPMLRVTELPGHPHFKSREMFHEASHSLLDFDFPQEGGPAPSCNWPSPPRREAPVMGEHCDEILREWLGLPDDRIAGLFAEKVLYRRDVDAAA
ncbi:MAG: CoA transferase [Novosphingobium sp.]|nr:CoA transferase [Novosphingobium sp.]